VPAELLVRGHPHNPEIRAPALKLDAPISFWGGVSVADGRLMERREGATRGSVGGTALFIRELRGSSSASSVLLELIHRRIAPAAIILAAPDAILALGVLAAREMGWPTPPILRLAAAEQERIPDGATVAVRESGEIVVIANAP